MILHPNDILLHCTERICSAYNRKIADAGDLYCHPLVSVTKRSTTGAIYVACIHISHSEIEVKM